MDIGNFLSSSIIQKIVMALTGLFLCTFLVAHLVGNLPLITMSGESARVAFNEYAAFMTTNPLIMVVSYFTYGAILYHAIAGLFMAFKNKQARPVSYAFPKAGAKGSSLASRNMGILGTLILVFIVIHMSGFWYGYKFGDMPVLMDVETNAPILKKSGDAIVGGVVKDGHIYLNDRDLGKASKDLYTEVVGAFQNPLYVLFYVLSMIAIGFHLFHGFQSAFQSLGLKNEKFGGLIDLVGRGFAIAIPFLFAIIPILVYLFKDIH